MVGCHFLLEVKAQRFDGVKLVSSIGKEVPINSDFTERLTMSDMHPLLYSTSPPEVTIFSTVHF